MVEEPPPYARGGGAPLPFALPRQTAAMIEELRDTHDATRDLERRLGRLAITSYNRAKAHAAGAVPVRAGAGPDPGPRDGPWCTESESGPGRAGPWLCATRRRRRAAESESPGHRPQACDPPQPPPQPAALPAPKAAAGRASPAMSESQRRHHGGGAGRVAMARAARRPEPGGRAGSRIRAKASEGPGQAWLVPRPLQPEHRTSTGPRYLRPARILLTYQRVSAAPPHSESIRPLPRGPFAAAMGTAAAQWFPSHPSSSGSAVSESPIKFRPLRRPCRGVLSGLLLLALLSLKLYPSGPALSEAVSFWPCSL